MMSTRTFSMNRRGRGVAMIVASGLALAALSGCSTPSPEAGAEVDTAGEGVPFGASKEDYLAAFEDIDPIVLQMQTGSTEGAPQNIGREAYVEAVNEWSGGKVTIELTYANGLVAAATESDDALADGRLDLSMSILPSYEPDIYPVNNVMNDLSTISPAGAFSPLVRAGWMTQTFFEDEAFQAEMEDAGIKVLLADQASPFLGTSMFTCAEPTEGSLSDLSGRSVAASGVAFTTQLSALGMAPVTMPWNETYEGLERGVVDCASGSLAGVQAGAVQPVALHAVIDDVPLATGLSYVGFGQRQWDDLPLVAQQVLFDRLDVLLAESSAAGMNGVADYLGGFDTVTPLDKKASAALQEATDQLISDAEAKSPDGVDIEAIEERAQKWRDVVVDDLDYGDTNLIDYTVDSSDYKDYDPSAYVDYLFENVLLAHRPGA